MDSTDTLLQSFALNNAGDVVHIDDVPRGAECACRCPVCNRPLVARQGDIRQWHFAHTSGIECSGASESALHRAAKEAIIRAGGLALPVAHAEYRHQTEGGREFLSRAEQSYGWIDFAEAVPEAPFGRVRADLWLKRLGFQLLVEIAVTNPVGQDKAILLHEMGIPTLEIRIGTLRSSPWSWADLDRDVVHSTDNKIWISSPDQQLLTQRARADAEARAEASAATGKASVRHRFEIQGMYVDVTERDFGICVWSSYHPEVSPIIARICRSLGGRWQPKFRNWIVSVFYRDDLLARLRRQQAGESAEVGRIVSM